jgi:DNA-binding NtrC family response regulator
VSKVDPPRQRTVTVHRGTGALTSSNGGCILRVVEGVDRGAELELLGDGEATVGTGSDCSLRLTDSTVSTRHLSVRIEGPGLVISDLRSKNGTYYLGTRLEKATVPHGATLLLGSTRLRLSERRPQSGQTASQRDSYGALVGNSPAMCRLYAVLEQLEGADCTVLIIGETGSGKEVVARELHAHSPRAKKRFEVCDCGSLAPTVVESELFGHAKGAFTGAHQAHAGVFARADSGTVFLDEIGELPLDLQPKLLRVLERREVRPVGGSTTQEVDVRCIAATNRPLPESVKQGTFRADLFFRLNVVTVEVPPLRERREDIPLLVRTLLAETGHPVELSAATLELFTTGYDWPGNVRELKNALTRISAVGSLPPGMEERAKAEARSGSSPAIDASDTFQAQKRRVIEAFERDYLKAKLSAADNNIRRAAREANMDRNHFRDLLRKYGLAPHDSDD